MSKNAATKAESKEMEKATNTAMVVADDYTEDAGAGFENQGSADRVIPFLNVLQGLSPQVKREPYRPGMIFNTATEQHWTGDAGVVFVPCLTTHSFLEYVPREAGGGFKGKHAPESKIVADAKAATTARGGDFGDWWTGEPKKSTELVETFEVYGVVCPDGEEPQPAIIPFSGMKIKRYKAWMTKLAMVIVPVRNERGDVLKKVNPPLFAFLSHLRTVEEKNAKGEFYNLIVSPARGEWYSEKSPEKSSLLPRSDARYQAAKSFRELVVAGSIKVNYDAVQGEGGGRGKDSEEPVPF